MLCFFVRIDKKNPFYPPNGITWDIDAFSANLDPRLVPVNLMDPNQTGLPQFDMAHLNCICVGNYIANEAHGFMTTFRVLRV